MRPVNGEKRLNLTAKEILEKDFKQGFRGYDQDEVDKFLDLIIKDYENFQKEFDKVIQENNRLRKEVQNSSEQTRRVPTSSMNINSDILQRLSNLEKHVFGSKLYD
ncbi:cell division regulator GpsB [Fictibacillus enclensis]|uniref:Cell division protein DivIVA n=1 Tax=Fictibacillus enclensis TaxID=1017270 RepID=A0A0V8JFR3_9BACL|nr:MULTISPECIES: cell division regulator GpsB [Fictibacillus]KSU85520.1 cell division protein DivIVA [Fictibacillus enclensis]MDM5338686.1 cell division regulator GpsB [Fictibacillus enclensis]RXY98790.1 cell division regulator GpsB [Fictibacillus sp. S7]WHY70186.1 cell division regulator GpsB [Fictibacillus enclensis]